MIIPFVSKESITYSQPKKIIRNTKKLGKINSTLRLRKSSFKILIIENN